MANKKNKGNVPLPKDKRVLYVPVGCGKCMECKQQKARQWQVRLTEEIRHTKHANFVTLTFNEPSLEKLRKEIDILEGHEQDNEAATLGVRRFLERWRKKYKKSVRHWLVTELGHNGTERIHLHGIIFTEHTADISKIWKYGHITIGKQKWSDGELIYDGENYVNEKTINYIIKYINKIDEKHRNFNSKILTSHGIGKNYIDRQDSKNNKYKGEQTKETYTTRQGIKLNLPTYYRNKIYTEEEREKLWLQKLDENIRWVNKVKIDVSKNDKEYYKALNEARKLNKELGYGDDSINWEKRKYNNLKAKLKKYDSDGNLKRN